MKIAGCGGSSFVSLRCGQSGQRADERGGEYFHFGSFPFRALTARERMLMEGMGATSAAYEVGYESVSISIANTAASSASLPCVISKLFVPLVLSPRDLRCESGETRTRTSAVAGRHLRQRRLNSFIKVKGSNWT